jgi:hypothetical protein
VNAHSDELVRRHACVEALELEVRKLRHTMFLNDMTWRNQVFGVFLRAQSILQQEQRSIEDEQRS